MKLEAAAELSQRLAESMLSFFFGEVRQHSVSNYNAGSLRN
jgi:hypothetical protein